MKSDSVRFDSTSRGSTASANPLVKQVWLILVALLFALSFAAARGDSPHTYRGLALEGRVQDIYFDDARGQPKEFAAADYVRSAFYQAPPGPSTSFYKMVPAKTPDQPPQREVVGQVEWPDAPGPYLVLVSQSGGKYEFSVIPDDELSFPMGSFRVINASRVRVLVKAGDKEAFLHPQKSVTLQPSPPEERNAVLFQVSANLNPPRQVYSNLWSGSQTTRTLVFIVNRAHPNYPIGVRRLHESDLVLEYQREKEASEAKEANPRKR